LCTDTCHTNWGCELITWDPNGNNDHSDDGYWCQCNSGYLGDGINTCNTLPLGTIVDNSMCTEADNGCHSLWNCIFTGTRLSGAVGDQETLFDYECICDTTQWGNENNIGDGEHICQPREYTSQYLHPSSWEWMELHNVCEQNPMNSVQMYSRKFNPNEWNLHVIWNFHTDNCCSDCDVGDSDKFDCTNGYNDHRYVWSQCYDECIIMRGYVLFHVVYNPTDVNDVLNGGGEFECSCWEDILTDDISVSYLETVDNGNSWYPNIANVCDWRNGKTYSASGNQYASYTLHSVSHTTFDTFINEDQNRCISGVKLNNWSNDVDLKIE
jgi:hypothetical protein